MHAARNNTNIIFILSKYLVITSALFLSLKMLKRRRGREIAQRKQLLFYEQAISCRLVQTVNFALQSD